jgi:hypothetical protein
MTLTAKTTLAGAALLNVPTLVAAAFLPAGALLVMAVALALVGAAIGWLIGWSHIADRHQVIELVPAYWEEREAA